MFLIFWNFRGSFLSLIFGFWKFWNCILNQNSHFWGGLFYETFWFEASFSTGDDFIASSEIIFLVPFLATREAVVLHANDLIMSGTSIRSFRHLEHQNLSSNGWDNCLVPFSATREAVAPLANDLIMSGTSIRSFRHLKHPNLSTGDDYIYSSGIIFLVPFLATREAVALHANDLIMSGTSIRSFRHLEHQNPSIISEDIGRARSVQQFRRNGGGVGIQLS